MKEKIKEYYIRFKKLKEGVRDYLFGHKDYKRFVVVGGPRTGSTLLTRLLDAHPEVLALGEEFKYLQGRTSGQVWNKVFRKRPRKFKFIGFKLLYFHPTNSRDREVWKFLNNDEEILIFHLTRKNLLRSFVSIKVGEKTQKWIEQDNHPHNFNIEDKQVVLSRKDCMEYFVTIEDYMEQIDQDYKRHEVIKLTYEDLVRDKRGQMDKIFKVMGLPSSSSLRSEMKKQNPERLVDLVLNYVELKEEFAGSKWESFFED